jgi:hypothetical protein
LKNTAGEKNDEILYFHSAGVTGMKTIRWGMLGCGDVTEVKSGPGFQKAQGSQLVAVMRRNAALAEDYARRHGVPKWYANAHALIHDPDVDAVYIATPLDSHCAYTLPGPGNRSTSKNPWRSTPSNARKWLTPAARRMCRCLSLTTAGPCRVS